MPFVAPPYSPYEDRIFDRLFRCAQRATVSNPRKDGVMASPPTVTAEGTTAPAALTNGYTYTAKPTLFRISGGTPVLINSKYRVIASRVAATGGNLGLSNGSSGTYARWETVVDAQKVAFRVHPTTAKYRFLVNGQYVSIAGTQTVATSGTTDEYISLDFGSRATRTIALETQLAGGFVGAYVGAGEGVYAPEASDVLRGIWIGDSYAVGTAAVALGDGIVPTFGDWMGIRDMWASGSSGTGWATVNSSYRFDERTSDATGYSPDIVFLQGSYNDRALSTATVQANCLAGLQAVRAALPRVPIVVFGAFAGATGPSAGVTGAETAVQSAVTAMSDRLTAFVPVSGDANGALISGTGKVGATTSSGNSDIYTDADGVHPTDSGCAFIGRVLAAKALSALRTIAP